MKIVFDIETICQPLADRAWAEPTEDTVKYGNATKPETRAKIFQSALDEWKEGANCALDPTVGQVALIAWTFEDDVYEEGESYDKDDLFCDYQGDNPEWTEKVIISEFFVYLSDLNPARDKLIGHNILKFDIPFLMHRAMLLGVKMPDKLRSEFALASYKQKLFFDTMLEWGFGDRHAYISLERLCGAYGIKAKESPVTGAEFFKWWAKDKESCIEYAKADVRATEALYEKMRGK